jgi:hypothetical protein
MRQPNHTGWRRAFVSAVTIMSGGWMLAVGLWALVFPQSFAEFIDFPPYNEHLLHDLGAFQIGIGASVLVALLWSDAIAVALLGYVVAGAIHTVNHGIDLDLGGHNIDAWFIGISTLLAAAALLIRLTGAPTPARREQQGGQMKR